MVVTTNDIGLKLRCNYNLSNRTVSHAAELEINEGLSQSGAEQTIVQAPNITMRITDRYEALKKNTLIKIELIYKVCFAVL